MALRPVSQIITTTPTSPTFGKRRPEYRRYRRARLEEQQYSHGLTRNLDEQVRLTGFGQTFIALEQAARGLNLEHLRRLCGVCKEFAGTKREQPEALKARLALTGIPNDWIVKTLVDASGRQRFLPRSFAQILAAVDSVPERLSSQADLMPTPEAPYLWPQRVRFFGMLPFLIGNSPKQLTQLGLRTQTKVESSITPATDPRYPGHFLHDFSLALLSTKVPKRETPVPSYTIRRQSLLNPNQEPTGEIPLFDVQTSP
jgi:hypothetical protein